MGKISVIIPNYNNSKWLSRCIGSCIEQGKEHLLEIVVVDDHSEDGSLELLHDLQSEYPVMKVYTNPGKGGNAARNFGFRQSSGEYIQWLDSDDFLLPGKFASQMRCFEKHPDADIVYSDWQMDFYEKDNFIRSEKVKKEQYPDAVAELLKNNWNVPCVYLCRRSIVNRTIENNGWNTETTVGQDREFFTKAAILGGTFRYCEGNTAVYNRWSTGTVSHVRHRENIEQAFAHNLDFYRMIRDSEQYPHKLKKMYEGILNAELLQGCFYFPSITINRTFGFFRINWKIIHWKMRPFIPFIYIWQYIKLKLGLARPLT